MLTKLIERIDAIGERISPIVVWEFRRAYRRSSMGIVWFVFTSVIILAAIVGLFYADTIEREFVSIMLGNAAALQILAMLFAPLFGGLLGGCCGVAIESSTKVIHWSFAKEKFPDYYMAVTSEQVYNGYYQYMVIQFFRVYSFVFCITLLTCCFPFVPFDVIVYAMVLSVLHFIMTNIGYTIACCCNPNRRRLFVQYAATAIVIVVCFTPMFALLMGFIFVSAMSVMNRQILTIEHWLPLLVAATITYLYTCKRLNKYNRQPKRSEWMKLFVTMSTLFTLTVIITGLGFLNYWYFGA